MASHPSRNLHYSPSNTQFSQSSRSSYPLFLSAQDSIQLQLQYAWRGISEAFRWNLVFSSLLNDYEIRANVYKCLLLNALSLISIYALDLLILPLMREQKWLHRNVGWIYQVMWLLPVVGVSFYLNSSWCSIIAKRTYTLQHGGRAVAQQPVTYSGTLNAIATSAYRVVMIITSVVVSFALNSVPYAGTFASFVFLCWVNSYYCFEFVWIIRGWSLSRRIRHLEERWAYYLAFGLPSAMISSMGSGLASAALFALFFPIYIIMAVHAHPVPNDPYRPKPSSEHELLHHPSPFIPIRIPVFALVVWLNDSIIRVLSLGGGNRSNARGSVPSRDRGLSNAAESIEEGQSTELRSPAKNARAAAGRINLRRAKVD